MDRMLGGHLDLAAQVHQERPVTDLADHGSGHRPHGFDQQVGMVVSRAAMVTSMRSRSCPEAVTSRAVTDPPADSTAVVSWLTASRRPGSRAER